MSLIGGRILSVIKKLKFVWCFGHVYLLVNSVVFYTTTLFGLVSGGIGASYAALAYQHALYGALLSYGLVLYRSFSMPNRLIGEGFTSVSYWDRIGKNQNVLYFFLATCWIVLPPMLPGLVPFCVYAIHHSLGYINESLEVIYAAVPPATPTAAAATATVELGSTLLMLSRKGSAWAQRTDLDARQWAAYWEVSMIGGWLLVSMVFKLLFNFELFLIAPLLYAQFLRARYRASSETREAFRLLRVTGDQKLLDPRMPPFLRRAYVSFRDYLDRIGSECLASSVNTTATH